MISIEDLHKSFDGVEVLRGGSLSVAKGEVLALIGPSGGGKTVLLKHLVGLMQPDEGRVVVDGQEVGRLRGRRLQRLRNRFGFLFQGGALFNSMTVFENVAFPLREKTRLSGSEIRERVLHELDRVGLAGSEQKYPSQISGGMVKRTALARALVLSPEIMLFDEPTTGLDPVIVRAIHALVESCHRHLHFTGIIVSHEVPAIFSLVDKVAMLHQGVIRSVGSPAEAMSAADPVVRDFVGGRAPSGPVSDQNASERA